jgi:hypothetical protein
VFATIKTTHHYDGVADIVELQCLQDSSSSPMFTIISDHFLQVVASDTANPVSVRIVGCLGDGAIFQQGGKYSRNVGTVLHSGNMPYEGAAINDLVFSVLDLDLTVAVFGRVNLWVALCFCNGSDSGVATPKDIFIVLIFHKSRLLIG